MQLYIGDPDSTVPRPIRELMGSKRIHLGPDESKRVALTLQSHQLGYHAEGRRYAVYPGRIEVSIGSSSQDLRLAGRIEIAGQRAGVEREFSDQVSVR